MGSFHNGTVSFAIKLILIMRIYSNAMGILKDNGSISQISHLIVHDFIQENDSVFLQETAPNFRSL